MASARPAEAAIERSISIRAEGPSASGVYAGQTTRGECRIVSDKTGGTHFMRPEECLLDVRAASAFLNMSIRQLWRLKRRREVGCYQRRGWVRFSIKHLDDFKRASEVPAEDPDNKATHRELGGSFAGAAGKKALRLGA